MEKEKAKHDDLDTLFMGEQRSFKTVGRYTSHCEPMVQRG